MARVIVRQQLMQGVFSQNARPTVYGEGLDQLDPTVLLTDVVVAAFAVRPNRVYFEGTSHTGNFSLADDFVKLELVQERLTAQHYTVYEFQGWRPRDT